MSEPSAVMRTGHDTTTRSLHTPTTPSRIWRASALDVIKVVAPLLLTAAGAALFLVLMIDAPHWGWALLHGFLAASFLIAFAVILGAFVYTARETRPALQLRKGHVERRVKGRNTRIEQLLAPSAPALPYQAAVRSAILTKHAENDVDEQHIEYLRRSITDER